jgi:hypothetical protein
LDVHAPTYNPAEGFSAPVTFRETAIGFVISNIPRSQLFNIIVMADIAVTEAHLKQVLVTKLEASHVEIEDMSGMFSPSIAPTYFPL